MTKKICVVTGSRAEYGLLRPLMDKIKKEPDLKLKLVVTGMHLCRDFGSTYKIIAGDGFRIDEKVNISIPSCREGDMSRSTALAITGITQAYKRIKPDIVVLLGDRFEIFGAAVAALMSKKIIVHIHGGELTEGAIDDAFRHSITKMSHIHFTAAEEYKRRVLQLGEDPKYVFNVGALGVDNIKNMKLLPKPELEKELRFTFGDKNLMVTFHPVTMGICKTRDECSGLLRALKMFKDVKILFTKANADPGGKVINHMIDEYVNKNPSNTSVHPSMGQLKYLSALQYVDAVVGNSSSGIIEAPLFGIPTVNIGNRQKGRLMAKSVIQCNPNMNDIERAIKKAFSGKFISKCKNISTPYGGGDSASKMIKIIKKIKISDKMLVKNFHLTR